MSLSVSLYRKRGRPTWREPSSSSPTKEEFLNRSIYYHPYMTEPSQSIKAWHYMHVHTKLLPSYSLTPHPTPPHPHTHSHAQKARGGEYNFFYALSLSNILATKLQQLRENQYQITSKLSINIQHQHLMALRMLIYVVLLSRKQISRRGIISEWVRIGNPLF